jgi:serine/threonine protein kinase
MYEMLAGAPPFKGESSYAILMKHKTEIPVSLKELRKDISPEVENIVMKAMAKELAKRYLRVEELIADIDKILGTEKAWPSIEKQELKKEKVKRSSWKILILCLTIVIILAIAFLSYRYIKGTIKPEEKDLMQETLKKLKELEDAQDTHKNR